MRARVCVYYIKGKGQALRLTYIINYIYEDFLANKSLIFEHDFTNLSDFISVNTTVVN